MQCPILYNDYPVITMAHGSGGKIMHDLINKMFIKVFSNTSINKGGDSAIFESNTTKQAFTTDSYVINPLFFPGGDIGKLAVYGTTNDLAMSGAVPKRISAGFIIEEGFKTGDLYKIVCSMKLAADEVGVEIVTGDTKVVDNGKGDGIFINTAGIGEISHCLDISGSSIEPGDMIIVNGDIARHGISVMGARMDLKFDPQIQSDAAPLAGVVEALIEHGIEIHAMRDLTRGGLAGALVEFSKESSLMFNIEERKIPIMEQVHSACELLGYDPLHVANEGRMVIFVPQDDADKTIEIMKTFKNFCPVPSLIGKVSDIKKSRVELKNVIGTTRIVDMLSGAQLPRIC